MSEPRPRLSAVQLARVEAVLRARAGFRLPASLREVLHAASARAAEAVGEGLASFLERVLAGDSECTGALVDHCLVGETYFSRIPAHFEAVRDYALRAPRDEALWVWSAGCSTGEEPYRLAMALLEAGRSEGARVLATDVSARALASAKEGRYSAWSCRRLEPQLRRWLEADEGGVRVRAAPRALVEFARHNLLADPPPSTACQFVFCRNVLIYFDPPDAARALRRLVDALRPGGVLVLAPAELPLACALGLEWEERAGTTFLRKPGSLPSSGRARVATPWPPSPARRLAPAPPHPARWTRPDAPAPAEPRAPAFADPGLERARAAARAGELELAQRLAQEAGARLVPEAFLLLGVLAEARGDLAGAVDAAKKALYLEPELVMGHAMLVALYWQQQRLADAERARENALTLLEGVEDGAVLRGVEAISASALRRALQRNAAVDDDFDAEGPGAVRAAPGA